MKNPSRRSAIKAFAALALASACGLALAVQVAGTVVNLSGPLLARKSDGAVKLLAPKSVVEQGDTLVAEKNTYARIRFADNSEVTLKPNTILRIDAFAYDAGKPEGDNASLTLVKGGVRVTTGLLGKRNGEKFALNTPSAAIGIRGSTFTAEWIEPSEAALAARARYLMASTAGGPGSAAAAVPLQLAQMMPPRAPTSTLAPGLYVAVIDGLIVMNNNGGSQAFSAGQFGYVRAINTPPVQVPMNPVLKFTPPPTFTQSAGTSGSNAGAAKSAQIDCEVR